MVIIHVGNQGQQEFVPSLPAVAAVAADIERNGEESTRSGDHAEDLCDQAGGVDSMDEGQIFATRDFTQVSSPGRN